MSLKKQKWRQGEAYLVIGQENDQFLGFQFVTRFESQDSNQHLQRAMK